MSIIGMYLMPHPPIIVPEIGKDKAKLTTKTIQSMKNIANKIALLKPETIIIISPHASMHPYNIQISTGVSFLGNFYNFGETKLQFEFLQDTDLIDTIYEKYNQEKHSFTISKTNDILLDHGTLVPLYYISKAYQNFKLVRLHPSFSSLSKHIEFGLFLRKALPKDKKIILIGSGDLSHTSGKSSPYGFKMEGLEFDRLFVKLAKTNELDIIFTTPDYILNKAAPCAMPSLAILSKAAPHSKLNLLSYENPFGIGYACIEYVLDNSEQYIKLAKEALKYYLENKKYMNEPPDLASELKKSRNGVFVSIYKGEKLRGCIGTILPTQKTVAKEIIMNAVSAGTKDPRFSSVTLDEISDLSFSVDILSKPKRCNKSDLNSEKYGVIVRKGYRVGVLLPNLKGVNDVEKQLQIVLNKAGINKNEYYTIERFYVTRYKEKL